ncbi:Alpha/beta-hydrolase [Favolaschia claudopus]|uniref:Carboxylic ester hydrolase n=1 Tax=Favolaschia claudopus TaxID=2862362 RepID=A0AAW0D6N3_9AGAR
MLFYSLTLLLVLPGLGLCSNPSGPIVHTSSGAYIGAYDTKNKLDVFLGMRFASPTARFMPATIVTANATLLQSASKFGADCPQLPEIGGVAGYAAGPALQGANQSEDCFFVNVWRPSGVSGETKLPILVYIYGGGYFGGAGSEWNGVGLVQRSVSMNKPIIYINFNYRIGVLGFLGSRQVPAAALNVGLQDQRDALRWIQNNAEAFGGDPSRITISGESAGASSVHMHYLYPDSARTFRAGISSSGNSLTFNAPPCEWHDRPGGGYSMLGNITGCGTGEGSFECLQNMPFDTFWPLALTTYISSSALPQPVWAVTCKGPPGSLVDEYPAKKLLSGDFLKLPIITGTNKNEGNFIIGTSFIEMTPQPSLEEENAILSEFIKVQAVNDTAVSNETLSKLLDLYAHPTEQLLNSTLYNRAAQFETDYAFLAPQRLFLKSASARGRKQDVWAYELQQHLPGSPDFLGAFHTSDLYYLDMGFPSVGPDSNSGKFQRQMQDIYITFTNDARPGIEPFWPKYDEESKLVMRLKQGKVGPKRDSVRRDLTGFLNRVEVMQEFGRFG